MPGLDVGLGEESVLGSEGGGEAEMSPAIMFAPSESRKCVVERPMPELVPARC